MGQGKPLERRLWEKVNKDGPVPTYRPELGPCWIFTGGLDQGYGNIGFGGRHTRRAHRVAYELVVGPIPEGLEIDHLCRIRACVNPTHLEAVTPAVNRQRQGAAVTHCPKGHQYTPDNIYLNGRQRMCRTCQIARNRAYRAKAREAATANEDRIARPGFAGG